MRCPELLSAARARLLQQLGDAAQAVAVEHHVGDAARLRHARDVARLAAMVLALPALVRKLAAVVRHDDAYDAEEEVGQACALGGCAAAAREGRALHRASTAIR